jgi:hypothetical protein
MSEDISMLYLSPFTSSRVKKKGGEPYFLTSLRILHEGPG